MKLDANQKKLLLFGGAAVLLLFFVLARSQSAKPSAPQIQLPSAGPAMQAQPVDLSPLTGFFQAVAAGLGESQLALASISQNQVVQSSIDLMTLGASSWLSCGKSSNGLPLAECLKQKGAVTVPGGIDLTDVGRWTHGNSNEKNLAYVQQAAAPYSSCKKADGSYDLQCVGYLIAGQPSLNVAGSTPSPAATRTTLPRLDPRA